MAGGRNQAVTFRTKLLLITSVTVSGAVTLATCAASLATRQAFERTNNDRRIALLKQFEREMRLQGAEVIASVRRAAVSETILRIKAGVDRPDPDFASFYNSAQSLAQSVGLDFVDVTRPDLTILSSAHWPARFGYKNDWTPCFSCEPTRSFLVHISMPDGSTAVALAAVRNTNGLLVIGARRLDPAFLKSLGEAPGMRALLWLSPNEVFDAQGSVPNSDILTHTVMEAIRGGPQSARLGDEAFLAAPLREQNRVLGVLLAASSLREQMNLENTILWIGVWVGGSGILLGLLIGWWTTERITRPVEQLARGARAVAQGDWSAKVDIASRDEIGELAHTFNRMTSQLREQRIRALQAERVAAWRELARRLAHELKNPLFPLQITIENLQRAKTVQPAEFEDIFHEGTATLLEEVKNLQVIIGRFSEFARMPVPQFERIDVNDVLRDVLKLYAAQLASGKKIEKTIDLTPAGLVIEADPEQLRRAFGNLLLNALDAMKQGGTLRVRTAAIDGWARIEVSDTGEGLTSEEQQRLFTPYYTTKQHGTGLGLAIVQSVVSDHHGKIAVESEPSKGATFAIDLPVHQPAPEEHHP